MQHSDAKPAALIGLMCLAFLGSSAAAAVVYSNIPTVLPGNYASVGYQATSTAELGDHIALASGGRTLQSVTLTMSDWALASTYGSTDPGYNHNLTLNLYDYVNDVQAGALIASLTIDAFIPWRPEADNVNCTGGAWYSTADSTCYNGLAFNVSFDFTGLGVVLPDDLVFGLAFDTQSYGVNPTGIDGPYNSLNYAVAGAPMVGTDVNPDGIFWNTGYQGFLTTGTAGVFGQDTAWSGYVPMIQVDTVPEPGSLALAGLALSGLAMSRRRRAR